MEISAKYLPSKRNGNQRISMISIGDGILCVSNVSSLKVQFWWFSWVPPEFLPEFRGIPQNTLDLFRDLGIFQNSPWDYSEIRKSLYSPREFRNLPVSPRKFQEIPVPSGMKIPQAALYCSCPGILIQFNIYNKLLMQ